MEAYVKRIAPPVGRRDKQYDPTKAQVLDVRGRSGRSGLLIGRQGSNREGIGYWMIHKDVQVRYVTNGICMRAWGMGGTPIFCIAPNRWDW
jgi:hypothetical protein